MTSEIKSPVRNDPQYTLNNLVSTIFADKFENSPDGFKELFERVKRLEEEMKTMGLIVQNNASNQSGKIIESKKEAWQEE